ncbi:hypothetical protein [Marininema halotolerans]|uniref:Uncharacterized protein n=1 Tax=Marininema halotolerans TaxID=1155944 RepID=A0A1I6SFZ2_9BACL|nr:hypothetical protein [Marininema halotolerans]SFS75882.1 hypothetical protein SAMN05444972_10759 [Marininema halotolerans]
MKALNLMILKEQQPNRHPKWNYAVVTLYTIIVLLFFTLVGVVLIPIFYIPLLIVLWMRRKRYPIIKVPCPVCKLKAKVEIQVTEFSCLRCYKRIVKEEDHWILHPTDPEKQPIEIWN